VSLARVRRSAHARGATIRVRERRAVVLELTRRGYPVRKIAEALRARGEGVSHVQVHRDLHESLRELRAEQLELAESVQTLLVEKAREMYRLAYEQAKGGHVPAIAAALRAIEVEARLLGIGTTERGEGGGGGTLVVQFGGVDATAWPDPAPPGGAPAIDTTATPAEAEGAEG
jgi:DNA-binding transcriptional MerR regulator